MLKAILDKIHSSFYTKGVFLDFEYYEILEISRDADGETIKKAYRKMALKYHPDRNQGDKTAEEKFKQINEAYQVLSDQEKRVIYDRHGKAGLDRQGFGGFSNQSFDDLSSIFESVFGAGFGFGNKGKSRKQRKYSLDIEEEVRLEFFEAIFGCKKEIKYSFKSPCKECNGTGSEDQKTTTCPDCNGNGQAMYRQGFMTFSQTCQRCRGVGQIITKPCKTCQGKSYEELKDKITVDIPEGIDDGNRIRVGSKGNIDQDKSRGDLYIYVHAKEDEHFVRDGMNIYIEVPVFFTQAALGESIKIPTLRGEKELKLPIGAIDKQQFVFKNEGVKDIHSNQIGSLVAQILVKYPKKLNDEQKELLSKLQNSFGIESVPCESKFEGVFDKIKGWFK